MYFPSVNNIYVKKQQSFFSCSFAVGEICEETDFCEYFQSAELPTEKNIEGSVLAWLCEDLQMVSQAIPNALRHLAFLTTLASKRADITVFLLLSAKPCAMGSCMVCDIKKPKPFTDQYSPVLLYASSILLNSHT